MSACGFGAPLPLSGGVGLPVRVFSPCPATRPACALPGRFCRVVAGQAQDHVALGEDAADIRVAVLDDHPAFAGLDYRGVEIMPFDRARVLVEGEARACGIVLSNVNPAQMKFRLAELRELLAVPVLGLWEPREGRRVGGGDAQRQ